MDIVANFSLIVQQLSGCLGIFNNRVFWLAVTSQLASMIAKMIIVSIQNRKFSVMNMFIYGGMPSSHTAFVMALVFGCMLEPSIGWRHPLTACVFVLSMIILSDAIRFRGAVDKINAEVQDLSERTGITVNMPRFVAHKPEEVVAGIIFAFIYTLLFYLFFGGLFR
ncbi:MAG: divergent PAP2 family protein [Spirochaetales bacterium]|nr:divergent PAP2 family protein [Spirochaetales bacterium]